MPKGIFVFLYKILKFFTQHCFICRPSDSTVLEDTEIESSARIYRPSFRENKPKTLVFYD